MSAVLERADRVDLHDRESRERLARMLVRLFDHWQLSPADQAVLLGLSPQSRSTVARYRRGEPLADNADLLARAGHLLGIHTRRCGSSFRATGISRTAGSARQADALGTSRPSRS